MKYPKTTVLGGREFSRKEFHYPSLEEIYTLSNEDIFIIFQDFNLVFKFCPSKICACQKNILVLSKTGTYSICKVCGERFCCRPEVFQNLQGDLKYFYRCLYLFSQGLNVNNFIDCIGTSEGRVRLFRKRVQSVIISGLENDDVKLGGGIDNIVQTDEMQKGRKRKGNGKQTGHPTVVHGDVVGICDSEKYKFHFCAKSSPGPPTLDEVEPLLSSTLKPGSILFCDGAKAYQKFQDEHPSLVEFLVQLNHSTGEWTRKITLKGKEIVASTNKIDGAWAHVRRFFSKHSVSQKDSFRYLKEFEFFFGPWARAQNPLCRLLYYMQLPVNFENIKGPDLPPKWFDISNAKQSRIAWDVERKSRGHYWRKHKCYYCGAENIINKKLHKITCKKYLSYSKKSVRRPKLKRKISHKKVIKRRT